MKEKFLRSIQSTHAIVVCIILAMMCSCSANGRHEGLREELTEFVAGKDANIGIAVIIDGTDTVAVNGDKEFPMLSVYKFPIALAFAEHCRRSNLELTDSIAVSPGDLHPDTYSPMTEKLLASSSVATVPLKMPAAELLAYMLQQSDNNASDIILRETGDAESVAEYLGELEITGVKVQNSEDEMHIDNSLCYANCATPIGMAALMEKFDREFDDPISFEIKRMMETCATGTDRLAKPLTKALIGHKTGTGFILPDGRLMAVNDAGYVHLPNGRNYAIAVFIENSGYDMARTEALIAEISQIVLARVR